MFSSSVPVPFSSWLFFSKLEHVDIHVAKSDSSRSKIITPYDLEAFLLILWLSISEIVEWAG